jgi:hypothetical protein
MYIILRKLTKELCDRTEELEQTGTLLYGYMKNLTKEDAGPDITIMRDIVVELAMGSTC